MSIFLWFGCRKRIPRPEAQNGKARKTKEHAFDFRPFYPQPAFNTYKIAFNISILARIRQNLNND